MAKGISPYAAVPRVSRKKGTSARPIMMFRTKYMILDIRFAGSLCVNLMSRGAVLMIDSYFDDLMAKKY